MYAVVLIKGLSDGQFASSMELQKMPLLGPRPSLMYGACLFAQGHLVLKWRVQVPFNPRLDSRNFRSMPIGVSLTET